MTCCIGPLFGCLQLLPVSSKGELKWCFQGHSAPLPSVCFRLSESDFVLPDSHTERPISLCLKVKNIDQKAIHWALIDLFSFAYEGHRDKLHTI